MSLTRYFLDIEDRIPASQIAVLERGAIVNGAQTGVNTVTVHDGHEFAISDKFLVQGPPSTRVFTVSGVADTTVTFSGNTFSFPDKAVLLNVGADTGGTQNDDGSWAKLNWDAGAISAYKDPAGDDTWTNGLVTVEPGGEVGFWGDGRILWLAVLDSGDIAVRVYPDFGATGTGIIRSATEPTVGNQSIFWIEAGGAPGGGDRIRIGKVKWDDTTWDWFDVGDADS
jgi:hypothetical protein